MVELHSFVDNKVDVKILMTALKTCYSLWHYISPSFKTADVCMILPLKEVHKLKLKMFEMSVLRRILVGMRLDVRRNVDVKNAVDIHRDIAELL